MNEREWWELVALNWADILAFCEEYLPMDSCQDYEGNDTTSTVRQHILAAYEEKNHVLARYINEAWISSPEGGNGHVWEVMNDLYQYEPNWEE